MKLEDIFISLNHLIRNSYSPYSKFSVSAIVEGEDSNFFYGVNIENASFGATICAERAAISSCISQGNKKIKNIYLLTNSDNFIFPCGICLQFISEFMDENGEIFIFSKNNKYKKYKLNDLILFPFLNKDLSNE